MRPRPTSLRCRAPRQRRGTVLVFVLGMLILVSLLGLVLITRTHGEHKRVEHEATAAAVQAATDGVVRNIRETLRRDIWGTNSAESYPLTGSMQSAADPSEENEPFDAPGPNDRWLASTTPYYVGQVQPDPSDPALFEEDVLAYHRVSYLGSDVLHPNGGATPFAWADNSRTPSALTDYTRYDDGDLEDVQILQTPPATYAGWPMTPGSTTNRTIAEARQVWRSAAHQTDLATVLPGRTAQFPYFDTNADGELDLYDADGDGVPDSPLSLVVELDSADPNEMHRLYVAIKIVDHSSMLNVNVASSLERPDGNLLFGEDNPTLQRRGQRLSELLLEEVAHPDDWQTASRTAEMVSYRSNGDPTPDPFQYDDDIVRRELIGGEPTTLDYALYGLSDEASLRHRGILAPASLADFDKTGDDPTDYRTIDRALRWSLLWNRYVDVASPFGYAATPSRWNRLNANYEPFSFTTTYEGYDDGVGRGWRSLLQEDQPFAIRRHLMTTVSHAVQPPPRGLWFERDPTANDPAFDRVTLHGVSPYRTALPPRDDTARQARLPGVGDLAMSWPVINRNVLAESEAIADWMRVLPIDLNMQTNAAENVPAMKAAYIEYVAAAMYLALDGVGSYQGLPLLTVYHTIPAAPPISIEQNREYLAWQFAVNLADYRDEDDVPTAIEWPLGSGQYLFGIEKQPFFTEAYAYLLAGTGPAPTGPSEESYPDVEDKWFYAVELYMPPGWNIPTENLYIRTPQGNPGFLPLGSFISVSGTATLTGSTISGGPADVTAVTDADHGNYYVLCSSTANAPVDLLANPTFFENSYQNPVFTIAKNGRGRVELWYSPDGVLSNPLNHMLDVIGPEQSGGPLADDTNSGLGVWGVRPPFILEGAEKQYSLLRSTKGWRFTTGWHVHTHAPLESSSPYERTLRRSLGGPNVTSDSLDSVIPESVWPARVNQVNQTPPDGFYSALPYETFDSVAELSRMYMIGSLNRTAAAPPDMFVSGDARLPATAILAAIIDQGPTGDFPAGGEKEDRIAAGRIDFVDARRVNGRPWTERFFDFFTTCHPLHDGIDNDGDDTGDGSLIDWNDPDEGIATLYRVAGRININTAPRSVLRSVPYMSLLPTSPEYIRHGSPSTNPASEFAANPALFWDFPSAIVAAREDRRVSLRLINASDALQDVAYAQKAGSYDSNGPGASGAFTNIAELARLTQVLDLSVANNHSLFNTQRFRTNGSIALTNHKIVGSPNPGPDLGDALGLSPFSPDFRYRGDNGEMDYIPILLPAGAAIGQAASNPYEAAGIRGRDIYLSRWANMLTTRSDCFTAYIALLDENGHYVARTEITLDRSPCFAEIPPTDGEARRRILPAILNRVDSSYADDTK